MSLQSRLAALITAIGVDYKRNNAVVEVASTATLTPTAAAHQFNVTAQAAALIIAAPTGAPIQGQRLMIRIKDNGTARAISWNAVFRAIGVVLPLTTAANKTLYVGAKWNSADARWDVLAVGQEA